MPEKITFRKAHAGDNEAVWDIIQQVIQTGSTYVFYPQSPKDRLLNYWMAKEKHTYVAELEGKIVGTFFISNNQPDLGSHIANASYMVHPEAQGRGVGFEMGTYSLEKAKELGYYAMQFNIVIKSNMFAIRLWQKLGFEIVGEIPEAFQHQELGLTNAYIMYRKL